MKASDYISGGKFLSAKWIADGKPDLRKSSEGDEKVDLQWIIAQAKKAKAKSMQITLDSLIPLINIRVTVTYRNTGFKTSLDLLTTEEEADKTLKMLSRADNIKGLYALYKASDTSSAKIFRNGSEEPVYLG